MAEIPPYSSRSDRHFQVCRYCGVATQWLTRCASFISHELGCRAFKKRMEREFAQRAQRQQPENHRFDDSHCRDSRDDVTPAWFRREKREMEAYMKSTVDRMAMRFSVLEDRVVAISHSVSGLQKQIEVSLALQFVYYPHMRVYPLIYELHQIPLNSISSFKDINTVLHKAYDFYQGELETETLTAKKALQDILRILLPRSQSLQIKEAICHELVEIEQSKVV